MNYKNIQSKLKYKGIPQSLPTLRADFPDLEAVTEQEIIDFYTNSTSTLVPSSKDVLTVADSMNVSLTLNDALTISNNFGEYSSDSHDGLDLVESAIRNYIVRESEILEARVNGMTSRLAQEVDQSILKVNNTLVNGLQGVNKKINTAREETRANFRKVAEHFNNL